MTNWQEVPQNKSGVDGIGCVASIMVLLLVFFVVSSALGGANEGSGNGTQTAVSPIATHIVALATVTHTPKPTHTATTTATKPLVTLTNTAVPSPTLSPIHTPLPADTAIPTNTPFPTDTPTPSPLPTPDEVYSWTLRVPILMYHYISIPPEGADIYRVDLSVAPDDFRAQMQFLAENGYTTIDFYDLSRAIAGHQELPAKPVIITLDDGYRDNYENAFPILQEYGLKATFFIVTDFVDQNLPVYMTWPMIHELAAAGHRIESHSKNHPDLSNRERDFLIWQILGSQETIAAHIGYMPRYFAYPSGRYDEETIKILQELDFWGAVTTLGGRWQGFKDRYEWRRLRVHNYTTLADFADLVDPANTIGGKAIR